MKLGVLFSGGKGSSLAMWKASKSNEVKVLISIISKNIDSYMFHTAEIEKVDEIANKLKIPLIKVITEGVKEEELEDLKLGIKKAIKEYDIEGVVTGAVASTYQASRVQKICNELDIECFNPLWQKNQVELLRELIENKFKVEIVKVAADGLDEQWIGKIIDDDVIEELIELRDENGISISGEGGEIETKVVDSPMFK